MQVVQRTQLEIGPLPRTRAGLRMALLQLDNHKAPEEAPIKFLEERGNLTIVVTWESPVIAPPAPLPAFCRYHPAALNGAHS